MGKPVTEGMTLVQAIVKENVRHFLDLYAEAEGLSRSDLVRRSLYAWYDKERARTGEDVFDRSIEERRQKTEKKEKARARARRKAA